MKDNSFALVMYGLHCVADGDISYYFVDMHECASGKVISSVNPHPAEITRSQGLGIVGVHCFSRPFVAYTL